MSSKVVIFIYIYINVTVARVWNASKCMQQVQKYTKSLPLGSGLAPKARRYNAMVTKGGTALYIYCCGEIYIYQDI